MYTEQLSQALSIAAAEIDPVSQGVGTVTTGALDLAKFHRVLCVLMVGNIGAAGTVDAKLQQAPTNAGAWTDIAGSSITTVTANNKVVTLEIRADQLAAGQRY